MLKEIPFFLFIVLCFPNCLVGVSALFLSLLFLVTPITNALLLPMFYMGLVRSQVPCCFGYKRSCS